MIHGVPISEIIYSLFLDCFNLIVIGFLILGALGAVWPKAIRHFFNCFLSIMLGYALALVIPLWGIPHNAGSMLWFVIPSFLFMIYSIIQLFASKSQSLDFQNGTYKYVELLYTVIVVSLIIIYTYNLYINIPSNWHTSSIVIFVTIFSYHFFKIDLPAFLPRSLCKEFHKFCFIMGLGIFFIYAVFWLYILFHATIGEPLGSFIPKGVVFAKKWSVTWGFDRLDLLIGNNWLIKE